MSFKVAAYVWKHSKHRGTSKLLLIALADFANDNGICWPSAATLAERINESERHTRALIKQLVDSGDLIAVAGGGRGKTTRYGIVVGMTDKQRAKLNSVLQNTVSENSDIEETVISGVENSVLQRTETVISGVADEVPFDAPERAKVAQNGGGIHHGSIIDPSEIAERAKSAPRSSPKKTEKTPEHKAYLDRKKAIEQAYVNELGYTPAAFGKEAKSSKWLAEQGYTPEQVVKCYRHLLADDFYAKQHISLAIVSKQIGAWLKSKSGTNGHTNGATPKQTYVPPPSDALPAQETAKKMLDLIAQQRGK